MAYCKLTLHSNYLTCNQCVWKMAKNFDLQDETKLAHEVQTYKCTQDKKEAATRVIL